eukprot:TRINITY_DN58580_c0_g2_i1.p1 TRINITY_DN58580_c0_g2~~TRINITY_DN58580_c0_g2_i1.p1  ORF type:complete len:105 (-),score=20.70 TRINITY_DN58580_c0_g2_i1:84-398(-)
MINGKRTSANSTIPFSEMRWMTASGGGGPGRLAGLPRGADVWVVVRGYDSMGDVTVTIDAAITDPSRVGDQGEVGASVSYTHLRAHETPEHLVCRLLLEKKKKI